MFKRRIGQDPHLDDRNSPALAGCPDIWELDSGDFAIIGFDGSNLAQHLPDSASCGADERIIVLPRNVLTRAKQDIPHR